MWSPNRLSFVMLRLKGIYKHIICDKNVFSFDKWVSIKDVCVASWLCSWSSYKQIKSSIRLDSLTIEEWFEFEKEKDKLERSEFFLYIGKQWFNNWNAKHIFII